MRRNLVRHQRSALLYVTIMSFDRLLYITLVPGLLFCFFKGLYEQSWTGLLLTPEKLNPVGTYQI